MKNIKRVPLFLLIIVFLAAGNNSFAQEKVNRREASSEIKKAEGQEKQKGTEKVTEAEEAAEAEAEKTVEADEADAKKAKEEMEDHAEKAGRSAENEAKEVKDATGKVKKDKELKQDKEKGGEKGQGNAYGKNKGDLQGRDFGQARAEEARMQQQTREAELDSNLVKGEEKVAQSRERIRVAREDLEKEKAGRKISEKDYQLKKEKIDNAEKAVNEFDQKVRNGRSLQGDK